MLLPALMLLPAAQLPYASTAEELAEVFSAAAGVSASALLPSVRLLKKGGAFTGTAFVDMPSAEAQAAGLLLDQSYLGKRRINVRTALPKGQLAGQEVAVTAAGGAAGTVEDSARNG
jgi:RNA recognition motif-containing protein